MFKKEYTSHRSLTLGPFRETSHRREAMKAVVLASNNTVITAHQSCLPFLSLEAILKSRQTAPTS